MEVNLIVKLEMMPCWCLFYNYADIRLLSVLVASFIYRIYSGVVIAHLKQPQNLTPNVINN